MSPPNHAIVFYQALLDARVQAEMHVFGYGDHGLGLAPGAPDLVLEIVPGQEIQIGIKTK